MAELEKTFSSKEAQDKWYKIWEKGDYFRPKKGNESFCTVSYTHLTLPTIYSV